MDTAAAFDYFETAIACFRSGDYLIDLASALTDLAECARIAEEFELADRHVAEALTIASTRGMALIQSAALAAKARICADKAAARSLPELIVEGKDAADSALRLAIWHRVAWHELDAMSAQAQLDQAEGIDRGWAHRADSMRAMLISDDLDPDPLSRC